MSRESVRSYSLEALAAPPADEFRALSEAESYTLNDEQQIYPTNQRQASGQIDLANPTGYAVVIWMVEDREAVPCAVTEISDKCKRAAIYAVVSKETAPTKRFGFRTPNGFNWWVTELGTAKTASGTESVRITFAEELRQGAYPPAGWPRRERTVCVLGDGLADPL